MADDDIQHAKTKPAQAATPAGGADIPAMYHSSTEGLTAGQLEIGKLMGHDRYEPSERSIDYWSTRPREK